MKINFVVNPSEEDSETIYQGLVKFNRPHFAQQDIDNGTQKVACIARNTSGETVGGLMGDVFSNTLFVQYLWVDEMHRHTGLGTLLMKRAEREMQTRGVTGIYLDTFSFQARDFYLKLGFTEVGRYTGFPVAGIDKIFLQKQIV